MRSSTASLKISHNDAASSSRAGRISNCGRMVAVLMVRDFITLARYGLQKPNPNAPPCEAREDFQVGRERPSDNFEILGAASLRSLQGCGFLIQERDRFPPREFSRLVRIGSPVPILTPNWAVDGFARDLRVGTFANARATPPRSYKFGISRPSGRTIFMRRRKFVPLLVRWPLAVITSPILIVFLSQPPYLPSMAGLLASPAHFSISPLSFFTSR